MKRILPILFALFLFAGCATEKGPAKVQFFAMDTVMTVTVYGEEAEEAARAVQAKINELDGLWSRTNESSDISAINAHAGDGIQVAISPETAELLDTALKIMEESGGVFDPLLAPVMDAWGFTKEEHRVPDQEELDALLELTKDIPLLTYEEGYQNAAASLPVEGQKLDLGGIAKGSATAVGSAIAETYEIDGFLLDLGGNLHTWGEKPDGSDWKVAVKDPRSPQEILCAFGLNGRTCATSGGYERYFEEDGEIYHHIIDPSTGYPAESGLISVTVIGSSAWADAYSTAFFVMGAERALEFWRDSSGLVGAADLILVTEEGHVYITEGLEESLDFRGEENGYTYEIVYR